MPAGPEPAGPAPAARRRLVFLHGFTQTHHHWHPVAWRVADRLGDDRVLAFVDLPGHGLAAGDATPIGRAGGPLGMLAGRGTYLGYSMGGRFALHAALDTDAVERLVLIGATPGIEDPDERAARRDADDRRAERVEHIGVDAFLDEWLAAPLFATLPDDAAGLRARRANTANGLAASLRTAGTGRQASLWSELGRIEVPVLVIAGALDTKFSAIGRRMAGALPDAIFVEIADAGHAAHAERPEATAATIADWLIATDAGRAREAGRAQPSASPTENRTP